MLRGGQAIARASVPWIASLVLLVAAGGGALGLRQAARMARCGVDSRPDPAALARRFGGDLPVLVVAADSSCGACRRALADVRGFDDLRAGGVHVETVLRGSGPDADSLFRALGSGPVPVYALLDAGGRPIGVRRGYLTPSQVRLWVRSALVGPGKGGRSLGSPFSRLPFFP